MKADNIYGPALDCTERNGERNYNFMTSNVEFQSVWRGSSITDNVITLELQILHHFPPQLKFLFTYFSFLPSKVSECDRIEGWIKLVTPDNYWESKIRRVSFTLTQYLSSLVITWGAYLCPKDFTIVIYSSIRVTIFNEIIIIFEYPLISYMIFMCRVC